MAITPAFMNKCNDYRIKKPAAKKHLPFQVATALDDCIEFHEGEKTFMRTIAPATRGQRAVYSSYWYHYEVCNGVITNFSGTARVFSGTKRYQG